MIMITCATEVVAMRRAVALELSDEAKVELEGIARAKTSPQRAAYRAKIVLHAAKGWTNKRIAKSLKTDVNSVAKWRQRYAAGGLDAILKDRPGRGRRPTLTPERIAEIVRRTREETPGSRSHWSRASMAKATGLSESTIGRIWKSHGLKPHRVETFKLSNDREFETKLQDIVGLYLSPPENAVVFSVDEKSQIQALDRTQPGLPLKKGRAGTMTHDYKRHGTTTLFAALNVLTGAVIGKCMPRHTNEEWLSFLKKLDRETPRGLDLHVICDNYATHKHPAVKTWLTKHPRVHVHFTPTSASWLNMVERFFRDLTVNAIRRGVFTSVHDLIDAIDVYLIDHNQEPKPFIWTATANDILAKVLRAQKTLRERVAALETASVC
jgi:transposase